MKRIIPKTYRGLYIFGKGRTMAIQGENMSDNWKEKLQEISKEKKEAIDRQSEEGRKATTKKKENEKEALAWVKDQLNPAFSELVGELKTLNGIKDVSHTTNRESLENTLDVRFEESILQYSIRLDVSSNDVRGRIYVMTVFPTSNIPEEYIPSIIKWGKQEIINNFLSKYEKWKVT